MNRKSKRSRVCSNLSRRLSCERLEHRALLAALFASAELPASTPEALEIETRAFIAETIEQFSQASGASPEQSHVASGRVVDMDGQAVKTTDLVVEFGPIWNGPSQESPLPPRTLTFSFIVLPNRAISVRATILNEYGISAPGPAELQSTLDNLLSKRLASSPEEVAGAAFQARDAVTVEHATESLLGEPVSQAQSGMEEAGGQVIRSQPIAMHPQRMDSLDDGMKSLETDPHAYEHSRFEHAGRLSLGAVPADPESAAAVRLLGDERHSVLWMAGNPSSSEAELCTGSLPVPPGMVMVDALETAGPVEVQMQSNVGDTALFQVFVSPLVGRTNSALQWNAPVANEPQELNSSASFDLRPANMILVTASTTWFFLSRFRNARVEPKYMITGLTSIGFLCHQHH